MTEAEWLAATDPNPMLQHLWNAPGLRKLRLFGAACCRQVWDRLTRSESRQAVEAVERFADGMVTGCELAEARHLHRSCGAWRVQRNAAEAVSQATLEESRQTSSLESAIGTAKYAAHAWTDKPEGGARSYRETSWRPLWDAARSTQVGLVRDIFGNPFRPITVDASWLTTTVVTLARQMYDSRDFSAMPILADALQEAGCDNADTLNHCRSGGPHVRGCWVIDLLLGKE